MTRRQEYVNEIARIAVNQNIDRADISRLVDEQFSRYYNAEAREYYCSLSQAQLARLDMDVRSRVNELRREREARNATACRKMQDAGWKYTTRLQPIKGWFESDHAKLHDWITDAALGCVIPDTRDAHEAYYGTVWFCKSVG